MRFIIICEGKTEQALKEALREFLHQKLALAGRGDQMPRLQFVNERGAVPMGEAIHRIVELYLRDADTFVIALTDVYPKFPDAEQAKQALRAAVGDEPRFAAHAAKHDLEAWLLPFWATIQKRSGVNQKPYSKNPETVNNDNPPAHRLKDLYQLSKPKPKTYYKLIEAAAILRENKLEDAANHCLELKRFLNTFLRALKLPELPE